MVKFSFPGSPKYKGPRTFFYRPSCTNVSYKNNIVLDCIYQTGYTIPFCAVRMKCNHNLEISMKHSQIEAEKGQVMHFAHYSVI